MVQWLRMYELGGLGFMDLVNPKPESKALRKL